jgi:hypothetical protein
MTALHYRHKAATGFNTYLGQSKMTELTLLFIEMRRSPNSDMLLNRVVNKVEQPSLVFLQ